MKRKKYIIANNPEILKISKQIKFEQSAISQRKTYMILRRKILERLGNKCIRCGYQENSVALQIDHIHGNGAEERKSIPLLKFYRKLIKLSDEELRSEYQCLCSNCNLIKKFEDHKGYMTPKEYDDLIIKVNKLKEEKEKLKANFWKKILNPYKNTNLTYEEISKNLDISANTVSKYMRQFGWRTQKLL